MNYLRLEVGDKEFLYLNATSHPLYFVKEPPKSFEGEYEGKIIQVDNFYNLVFRRELYRFVRNGLSFSFWKEREEEIGAAIARLKRAIRNLLLDEELDHTQIYCFVSDVSFQKLPPYIKITVDGKTRFVRFVKPVPANKKGDLVCLSYLVVKPYKKEITEMKKGNILVEKIPYEPSKRNIEVFEDTEEEEE